MTGSLLCVLSEHCLHFLHSESQITKLFPENVLLNNHIQINRTCKTKSYLQLSHLCFATCGAKTPTEVVR